VLASSVADQLCSRLGDPWSLYVSGAEVGCLVTDEFTHPIKATSLLTGLVCDPNRILRTSLSALTIALPTNGNRAYTSSRPALVNPTYKHASSPNINTRPSQAVLVCLGILPNKPRFTVQYTHTHIHTCLHPQPITEPDTPQTDTEKMRHQMDRTLSFVFPNRGCKSF
jgi:hypothetical protein